jgi:hypothetical protein
LCHSWSHVCKPFQDVRTDATISFTSTYVFINGVHHVTLKAGFKLEEEDVCTDATISFTSTYGFKNGVHHVTLRLGLN